MLLNAYKDIDNPDRTRDILIYSSILILVSFSIVIFASYGFYRARILSMRTKSSTSCLVFEKFWLAPMQMGILFYLMIQIDFRATICAMVIIVCLTLSTSLSAYLYTKVKYRLSKVVDRRLRVISDVILGVRVVKLFAWEAVFGKITANFRKIEAGLLLRIRLLQTQFYTQLTYQVGLIMTIILTISLLLPLDQGGVDLPYSKLFESSYLFAFLNYLYALQITVSTYLPLAIFGLSETLLTCRRIQEFLLLPEQASNQPIASEELERPSLCFDKFTATWDETNSRDTLSDISFKVEGPMLVAIVGEVGCAKSSLLLSAFGELPAKQGHVQWTGRVAYLPQLSWIFPGTIRDNILNFSPFDRDRYESVLRATTIDTDIEQMPLGDATQVGERGIVLSGGQKTRIGLARAAYSNSTLLLLDDPLAAVDARVGNAIFERCINRWLGSRLRLLVTNQHQFLPLVDLIIFIKKGQIQFIGTYQQYTEFKMDMPPGSSSSSSDSDRESLPEVKIEEAECDGYASDNEPLNALAQETAGRVGLLSTISSGSSLRLLEDDELLLRSKTSSYAKLPIDDTDEKQSTDITFELAGRRKSVAESNKLAQVGDGGDDDGRHDDKIAYDEEGRRYGMVKWKNYAALLGFGSTSNIGIVISVILFITTSVIMALSNIWLAKWAEIADAANLNASRNVESGRSTNDQTTTFWTLSNPLACLTIYGILIAALIVFSNIRSIHFFVLLIRSTRRLHNKMFNACLATRLSFFEKNPSGRIINRFSKDIGLIDDQIPTVFHDFLGAFLNVAAGIVIAIVGSPWVLIPAVLLFLFSWYLRYYYLKCSRDLRRLEANARSPVFSWVNVTIQGLPCIRASNNQGKHIDRFRHLFDQMSSINLMVDSSDKWMMLRADLLCSTFVASVAIICALLGIFSSIEAAQVGLMLTSTMGLVAEFPWCLNQSSDLESKMVSVERVTDYTELEPELTQPPILPMPPKWPREGQIVFDQLWLRYNPAGPWILKGIDFEIEPSEKIGIVGRTGAGKSSLISVLFRLVEPERGSVCIDGVNIGRLELPQLRSRLAIISQDPIMFTGTIRCNLDPQELKSDKELLRVLELVQMKYVVDSMPDGLDSLVSEGGTNFSTGQCQLINLARAMLIDSCLLVVDEATANVDPKTDKIIQQIIRSELSDRTIITVAHRLHTVIDNDRIIVMDSGQIVESGPPYLLLVENPRQESAPCDDNLQQDEEEDVTRDGPFASLVKQTGQSASRQIVRQAREAYFKKPSPV